MEHVVLRRIRSIVTAMLVGRKNQTEFVQLTLTNVKIVQVVLKSVQIVLDLINARAILATNQMVPRVMISMNVISVTADVNRFEVLN